MKVRKQRSIIGMPIYKFVGQQFYSCGVSENRRRDCTWTCIVYPFLVVSLYTSFSVFFLYLKRIASGLDYITFRFVRPCTGRKVSTFLYFCSLSVSFDWPSDFIYIILCNITELKSGRLLFSATRSFL